MKAFARSSPADIPSCPCGEQQCMQVPKPISGRRNEATTIDSDQSGFAPGAGDRLTHSWIVPGGEVDNETKEKEERNNSSWNCHQCLLQLNYSATCQSYYVTIKIIIKYVVAWAKSYNLIRWEKSGDKNVCVLGLQCTNASVCGQRWKIVFQDAINSLIY